MGRPDVQQESGGKHRKSAAASCTLPRLLQWVATKPPLLTSRLLDSLQCLSKSMLGLCCSDLRVQHKVVCIEVDQLTKVLERRKNRGDVTSSQKPRVATILSATPCTLGGGLTESGTASILRVSSYSVHEGMTYMSQGCAGVERRS